jgi:7-carboxy-7-deazaguanine synthase
MEPESKLTLQPSANQRAVNKKIPLMEIFGPTIQGEGAMIGVQTYFLRFGLCDYRCTMCDSLHAVLPASVKAHGEFLLQEDIAKRFYAFHKRGSTPWITFSGGNPCIHDLQQLVGLLKPPFKIAVETQGTFCPEWLRDVDLITISPKGPGMGEDFDQDKMDAFVSKWVQLPIMNIKVVVFDQRDLEFAKMIYERYFNVVPDGEFYLSLGNDRPPAPEGASDYVMTHSEHMWQLRQKYMLLWDDIKNDPILSKFRFLPQWHVFVWGNAKGY